MANSKSWSKEHVVGFVDETGNMTSRVGETHSIAGVFMPALQLEDARAFAGTLMNAIANRIEPGKRAKAGMLTREEFRTFARHSHSNGWVCYRKKTEVTQGNIENRERALKGIEAGIEQFSNMLQGPERFDLTPHFIRVQLQEESLKNPVYLELFYFLLRHMAEHFHKERRVPLLKVWFDRKIAPENSQLANFFLRWLFYVQFADAGEFTVADVFGLTQNRPFRCFISSDKQESGLFLADVMAHIVGQIDRDSDDDNFFQSLIDTMDNRNSALEP